MYDPASETWQVINTPTLAEASGWADLGVGQVETRIYALGGRQNDAFLAETLVFAPLVLMAVLMGVLPGYFLERIEPSVQATIADVKQRAALEQAAD